MNSKIAKDLRFELKHRMGVAYNDAKYQSQVIRWLVCKNEITGRPVYSEYPVHFGGILIGFVVPVKQIRLNPTCGRALYRKAKKLLKKGNKVLDKGID